MLLAGARVSFHFIIVLLTTLLVGFSGLAHASTPQQTAPAATQQKPEQPSAGQPDTDKPSTDKPSTGKPENKITPEQAEQLFRDVDTILNFASKDTTLPIKHEVKRRMASREEVVSYLKKNMAEDKDVQRLRRTELVLKKFGLLPKDFDLQTFLVSLLEEQVAGYYDSKTKTVNLLDWVLPDLQRPVLAHELTHALQDQSFNLDKWLKRGAEDLDTKKDLAHEIYPNWRGGYYYSVHPKGNPNAALGLLFVSKWASAKSAAQFAAIYARGMQQRYKNAAAPADSNLPKDLKTLSGLSGDHTWTTEEGAVVIAVINDNVLVTE